MDSIECNNCIWDAKAIIGEGPIWVEEQNSLYWVDINSKQILIYNQNNFTNKIIQLPYKIGWAFPSNKNLNILLCGFKNFIGKYNITTKNIEIIHEINEKHKNNRLNDAKFDCKGNLWTGTMDDDAITASGYLYKFSNINTKFVQDGPYIVTNGPAINYNETILYHADSISQEIYKFKINKNYDLVEKTSFIQYNTTKDGFPDGMTIDTDDHLWVARYGANKITRYDPSGQPNYEIILPAKNVTSCCFGGPNYNILYITTARNGLSDNELELFPFSGGLFKIELPFSGFKQNYSNW